MKRILLILFLLAFLSPVSFGEEYADDFRYAVDPDDPLLSSQTELQDPSGLSEDLRFNSFVAYFFRQIAAAGKKGFKMLAFGVALALFSALVGRLSGSMRNRNYQLIFSFVVSLSAAMMCGGFLQQTASELQAALKSMKVFTAACIPSFTVVMIGAGESGGASVFSALMVALGEISALISDAVLLPLTDVYLALGICVSVSDEFHLEKFAARIKKILTGAIGLCVGAFHLIGKLQSSAANAGDTVLKKTIRSAVGSMIPMVGSNLAEGLEGLFAAANGVKTSFAIAGVLIVLSVMCPVLIHAGLYGLCWSGCRWLAEFLDEKAISELFKVLSDGFYMVLILGCGVTFMGLLSFFGLMVKNG